jgi:hypothetical protein
MPESLTRRDYAAQITRGRPASNRNGVRLRLGTPSGFDRCRVRHRVGMTVRIQSESPRPWQAIRERAGMRQVISYALRHASIVRGLRKGLPIQQVAKLHNTSVKMIERHYAKYIATALEDLARAAVVPLVPRDGGNVVPMGRRA